MLAAQETREQETREEEKKEQDRSTEASGEHKVITVVLGELADTTGVVHGNTSHITALSTTLMGGAQGSLLRIGRGVMDLSELSAIQKVRAFNPLGSTKNPRT